MTDLEFLELKTIQLQSIVKELEERFKPHKRKFTLDGHLLGSIGEIYAHLTEGYILSTPSRKSYDTANDVQIKITQGKRILLTSDVEKLLVYKLEDDGKISKMYSGPSKHNIKLKSKKFIYLSKLKPNEDENLSSDL